MKSRVIWIVCVVALAGCVKTESDMAETSAVESEWVPLVNGKNL